MPSASDEDRAWAEREFGDPISEAGPMKYLEDRGYRLTKNWEWFLPFSIAWPTLKDWKCINFLIDEWDFGGLTLTPREGW